MPRGLCCYGCVMTLDEKYVILFGGYSASNDILVFDMKRMKWSVSKLKCPHRGPQTAILMLHKSNTLVHAFIKFMCDSVVLDKIPMDVISLIVMYGNQERIHLFVDCRVEHYTIDVFDILSNCS